MNIILVVLGVAGRMLKCKTSVRKSEVEWVITLILNISEPWRDRKGAADAFGSVKQNFPLGFNAAIASLPATVRGQFCVSTLGI